MFIYLKLFHIILSKLFHICFGLDILSLTDASACPNLLLYQDTILLTSLKYTKVLFFYYLADSGLSPISDVRCRTHQKRTSGFYKKPLGPSFFWTILFSQPSFSFSALYYDACELLPAIRSSMPSKFCSRSHGSYTSDGPACAAAYKIHRDIHSVPGVFRPARSTVQHYRHFRYESFRQTSKAL